MFGIVIYSLYLCIRNQSGNRLMKSLKIPCGLTSLARILQQQQYKQINNYDYEKGIGKCYQMGSR